MWHFNLIYSFIAIRTPGLGFPNDCNLVLRPNMLILFLNGHLLVTSRNMGQGVLMHLRLIPGKCPEQYLGGSLAESWEVSPNGQSFTFHVRHGVMWTGNQKIGMAPRELTADDIVSSQKRALTRPGLRLVRLVKVISSTDKYTVVWTCNTYYVLWSWRMCGTV